MTDDEILDGLCRLLPPQFEAFLLHAEVPSECIAPSTAAPATRAAEVVRWMRQRHAVGPHREGVRVLQLQSPSTLPRPKPSHFETTASTCVSWLGVRRPSRRISFGRGTETIPCASNAPGLRKGRVMPTSYPVPRTLVV